MKINLGKNRYDMATGLGNFTLVSHWLFRSNCFKHCSSLTIKQLALPIPHHKPSIILRLILPPGGPNLPVSMTRSQTDTLSNDYSRCAKRTLTKLLSIPLQGYELELTYAQVLLSPLSFITVYYVLEYQVTEYVHTPVCIYYLKP
jgi:hypothetical protein